MTIKKVPRATVLMVEGEKANPELVRALASEGYQAEGVGNARAALEKMGECQYQAVVLDLDLPGGDVLEVLGAAARAESNPAVIACAANASVNSLLVALRLGAHEFLQKPLVGAALVSALRNALERRRLLQELVSLRQVVDVLASLHNLEKTYAHLRNGIAELFQAQGCSLALLDTVRGEIVAQTPQYGSQGDNVPRHRFSLSESRVSKIILDTGEPFLSNAVPEDPLFEPGHAVEGLENLLAVPMRTAAGPIGFIYVVNRPGGFSQLEADLLLVIGEQVAAAVQSAHSFEAAHREAITDPLTELYNRRFFDARLRQEVERARRAGRPIALMFLDIDRFKQINDRHGHQAGNLVLCQVARVIRQSCRSADVPARWGGDEFIMLLTEANPGSVEMVACRIRDGILQTAWDPVGMVTVAMGIAVMPQDADNLEDLLRAADEAMYLAKKRGRNTYVLAHELRRSSRTSQPASA